jgi:hypothetical protein
MVVVHVGAVVLDHDCFCARLRRDEARELADAGGESVLDDQPPVVRLRPTREDP